jgi:hypothetical protein
MSLCGYFQAFGMAEKIPLRGDICLTYSMGLFAPAAKLAHKQRRPSREKIKLTARRPPCIIRPGRINPEFFSHQTQFPKVHL